MRKTTIWVIALALLIGTVLVPAAAQSTADPATLAAYFPEDAPVFVSLRTDDVYIDMLNDFVDRLRTFFPNDIPAEASFTAILDEVVDEVLDQGNFEVTIRPWLGDTMAFGITSAEPLFDPFNNDLPPFIFAVEVRNREIAEFFLANLIAPHDILPQRTVGDFTVFTVEDDLEVAVDDVALFIVPDISLLNAGPDLAGAPSFTNTMGLLPATEYFATAYFDANSFNQGVLDQAFQEAGAAEIFNLKALAPFFNVSTTMAAGFTILDDGDTYSFDIAQISSGADALAEAGIETAFIADPVDLEFSQTIPADSILAVHGSDLGPATISAFDSLRALDDFIKAQGGTYQCRVCQCSRRALGSSTCQWFLAF